MRPHLIALALFSLTTLPVMAQTAPPADRYGAASAAPRANAAPTAGYLNWAGKTQAAAGARTSQAGAPQLLPNGLLSHSSAVPAATPLATAPQAAAPRAPALAAAAPRAPISAAPLNAALANPDPRAMNAAAPDGLLGVAPPVGQAQSSSLGAL